MWGSIPVLPQENVLKTDTHTQAVQTALLALKNELMVHTDLGEHLLLDPTIQLVDRWQASLATGSDRNFIFDVDSLIVRLEMFKVKARRALPIANGGFEGYEPYEWKRFLAEHSITFFRVDDDDWTFLGAGSESFESEEDALNAALQAHPHIVAHFWESRTPHAKTAVVDTTSHPMNDSLHSRVFRPDGRLRGVSYCKPSTLRGAVITVKPTANESKVTGKVTSFMLDGNDFHAQYARSVRYIADHHGITVDSPLISQMMGTANQFLKHYRLRLREVTFKTAFHPG